MEAGGGEVGVLCLSSRGDAFPVCLPSLDPSPEPPTIIQQENSSGHVDVPVWRMRPPLGYILSSLREEEKISS